MSSAETPAARHTALAATIPGSLPDLPSDAAEAPEGATEEALAAIWAEVLGVERVESLYTPPITSSPLTAATEVQHG